MRPGVPDSLVPETHLAGLDSDDHDDSLPVTQGRARPGPRAADRLLRFDSAAAAAAFNSWSRYSSYQTHRAHVPVTSESASEFLRQATRSPQLSRVVPARTRPPGPPAGRLPRRAPGPLSRAARLSLSVNCHHGGSGASRPPHDPGAPVPAALVSRFFTALSSSFSHCDAALSFSLAVSLFLTASHPGVWSWECSRGLGCAGLGDPAATDPC